jgi:hypothetical protein
MSEIRANGLPECGAALELLERAKEINRVFKLYGNGNERRVSDTTLEWLQGMYEAVVVAIDRRMKPYQRASGAAQRGRDLLLGAVSFREEKSHRELLSNLGERIIYNLVENEDTLYRYVCRDRGTCPGRSLSQPQQKPLLTPLTKTTEDNDCPICQNLIGDIDGNISAESLMQLPCGHVFGDMCIDTWMRAHESCPCCRKVFGRGKYEWPPSEPLWVRALSGQAGIPLVGEDVPNSGEWRTTGW